MKPFLNTTLIAAVLTLTATSAIAQPGTANFEQWYRAKYGHPSPAAQAAPTTQAAAPSAQTAQPTVAVTEFEHWYRAKYGRPAPTEQAQAIAPQSAQAPAAAVALSPEDLLRRTPAEHQRIAQTYREQAQAYLAQAKEHESMIAAFKANPSLTAKNPAGTIDHCQYFAAKFHDLAAKSQQLAKAHEDMAMRSDK